MKQPVPVEEITVIPVVGLIRSEAGLHEPDHGQRLSKPHPLDDEGHRLCAREGCDTTFKPDTPSRAFCGYLSKKDGDWVASDCAALSLYERFGITTPKRLLMAAESAVEGDAPKKGRALRPRDPEKEAAKEKKYGPLRDITERVNDKRAKLGCGHEAVAWGNRKRTRCPKCRDEAAGVQPRVKKQPVPPVETAAAAAAAAPPAAKPTKQPVPPEPKPAAPVVAPTPVPPVKKSSTKKPTKTKSTKRPVEVKVTKKTRRK